MSDQQIKFADLLKEERSQRGMSQKDLGREAGVSPSLICLYEHGDNYPKLSTAKKLAKGLDLSRADRERFLAVACPTALRETDAKAVLGRLTTALKSRRISPETKRRLFLEVDAVVTECQRARIPTVRWGVITVGGWQSQMLANNMTARLIRKAAAELTAAEIERLVLVISPTQRRELPDLLETIPDVRKIKYVVQENPLGFGHAVLEGWQAGLQHETIAVVTPDESVGTKCLRSMIDLYKQRLSSVVAVRKTRDESERGLYGVVVGAKTDRVVIDVTGLEEKPDHPSDESHILLGRYILPPTVFSELTRTPKNPRTGHVELTDALQALLAKGEKVSALIHRKPFLSLSPSFKGLRKALEKLGS